MAACEAGPCDRMITCHHMGDNLGKCTLISSFLGELGVALRKGIFMRKLRALKKSNSINLCPRQILCLEIRGESTVWSAAASGESTHTKCTKYWRSTRKMFEGKAERDTPSKKISFQLMYQNVKIKCRSKPQWTPPPTSIEWLVWQNILYSPWRQTATDRPT